MSAVNVNESCHGIFSVLTASPAVVTVMGIPWRAGEGRSATIRNGVGTTTVIIIIIIIVIVIELSGAFCFRRRRRRGTRELLLLPSLRWNHIIISWNKLSRYLRVHIGIESIVVIIIITTIIIIVAGAVVVAPAWRRRRRRRETRVTPRNKYNILRYFVVRARSAFRTELAPTSESYARERFTSSAPGCPPAGVGGGIRVDSAATTTTLLIRRRPAA